MENLYTKYKEILIDNKDIYCEKYKLNEHSFYDIVVSFGEGDPSIEMLLRSNQYINSMFLILKIYSTLDRRIGVCVQ